MSLKTGLQKLQECRVLVPFPQIHTRDILDNQTDLEKFVRSEETYDGKFVMGKYSGYLPHTIGLFGDLLHSIRLRGDTPSHLIITWGNTTLFEAYEENIPRMNEYFSIIYDTVNYNKLTEGGLKGITISAEYNIPGPKSTEIDVRFLFVPRNRLSEFYDNYSS